MNVVKRIERCEACRGEYVAYGPPRDGSNPLSVRCPECSEKYVERIRELEEREERRKSRKGQA